MFESLLDQGLSETQFEEFSEEYAIRLPFLLDLGLLGVHAIKWVYDNESIKDI